MFTVYGVPVSPNDAYRRSRQGRMYMTTEGHAWKEGVALCGRLAMQGLPPIEGPYAITMRAFFPSRRFDLASVEKLTSDALQGIVIENDRLARRIVLEWGLDRARPRVEIVVEEIARLQGNPRRSSLVPAPSGDERKSPAREEARL